MSSTPSYCSTCVQPTPPHDHSRPDDVKTYLSTVTTVTVSPRPMTIRTPTTTHTSDSVTTVVNPVPRPTTFRWRYVCKRRCRYHCIPSHLRPGVGTHTNIVVVTVVFSLVPKTVGMYVSANVTVSPGYRCIVTSSCSLNENGGRHRTVPRTCVCTTTPFPRRQMGKWVRSFRYLPTGTRTHTDVSPCPLRRQLPPTTT